MVAIVTIVRIVMPNMLKNVTITREESVSLAIGANINMSHHPLQCQRHLTVYHPKVVQNQLGQTKCNNPSLNFVALVTNKMQMQHRSIFLL